MALAQLSWSQNWENVDHPPQSLNAEGMGGASPAVEFDSFASPDQQNKRLAVWHTWEVPFGGLGSPTAWTPEMLAASTLVGHRQSFIQKVQLNGGWLNRSDNNSMGASYFSAAVTMTAPLGSMNNILLATPTYRIDWLDGPLLVDTPPRLYSQFIDLAWRSKINGQLSTILGVRPGVFSDYQTSRNAVRVSGLAAVQWENCAGISTWLFGVAYLDRNDFSILPVIGLNWKPSPDHKFDLVFPRPKIAYRVGHIPYFSEDWIYLSGSIGGNTWAVEPSPGVIDELTLFDYRIAIGIERIVNGGTGASIEIGYAFGRRLEYEIAAIEIDLDDSFVVEAGFSF